MGDAVNGARAAASTFTTVAFPNEGDFSAWHDAKCLELGIPTPGANQASGAYEPGTQWTTAYVAPVVDEGYYCVTLPADEIAADPILKGLEVWTFKNPVPAPPSAYEIPVPPTWTDPATDITYDTSTGEPV
jgi:hypothetical protein